MYIYICTDHVCMCKFMYMFNRQMLNRDVYGHPGGYTCIIQIL